LSQKSFPGVLNGRARLHLAVAAALPFVLFTTQAGALGLGPVQVRSNLGDPLHVVIPVNAGSADEVGCVQVTSGNDLPGPIRPRAEVQTSPGGGVLIDITSPVPTNEPAIGFAVSAGCQSAVSRSYTLFLDPPLAGGQLPAAATIASSPLGSIPITTGTPRRRRSRGGVGQGNGGDVSPADAIIPQSHVPKSVAPAPPSPRRSPKLAPVVPQSSAPDSQSGDRFHLSSDIGTDLRLADELGTPDAQPIDAQQLQELKDERLKLAAILAGQNPANVPTAHETELQNRVNGMSTEIATLRQQLAQQDAHTKELEAAHSSGYLNWIFGILALLALAVAGWFGLRYRRAQGESSDQPWWEQSQLAHVTERGGSETPFSMRRNSVAAPAPIDEPEVLDHDTFIQTTKLNKPAAAVVDSMPLKDGEPNTAQRGPVTMPMVPPSPPPPPPPAPPVAPPAILSPPIVISPGAPTASAPRLSPLAPAPLESQYGDAKSSHGTLDERIDSAIPKPLDFNLDLPPVTTNLGHDDKGVAASGSLQNERPTELAPLDFELPKTNASEGDSGMGPDTILRLDEQASVETPYTGTGTEIGEQASVQFRLIQFASVVEQAEELERSQEPTKAIAALRQYVLRDETIPTLMWLMLFNLYKQVNKRPVYDALGEHFSRRYKRPMARWDESLQSIAPQTSLANLPELDAAIKAKWGRQAGIEMLRALTCGRDQPNEIIFNAVLQRDLLQMAKVFPLSDTQ
jgi:hypothetical protein